MSTFSYKYLSIFIDKFVPDFFQEKYPNYKKFIQYFLEYLEQDGKTYNNLSDICKYFDLDKILTLSDATLQGNILDEMYGQFIGDKNFRKINTLLYDSPTFENQVKFLEYQRNIINSRGYKNSFLLFFAFVLGYFVRVLNVSSANKLHDGFYQYNGFIDHSRQNGGIVPFAYIIESNLEQTQYESILPQLHPAGFSNMKIYKKYSVVTNAFTENLVDVWNGKKRLADYSNAITNVATTGYGPLYDVWTYTGTSLVGTLAVDDYIQIRGVTNEVTGDSINGYYKVNGILAGTIITYKSYNPVVLASGTSKALTAGAISKVTVGAMTGVYAAVYNGDTYLGMLRPYKKKTYYKIADATDCDLDEFLDILLDNGNKYRLDDVTETGSLADTFIYSIIMNTYYFPKDSGDNFINFNRIKIYSDVVVAGIPALNISYTELPDSYNELYDCYVGDTGEVFPITDSTVVDIVVGY